MRDAPFFDNVIPGRFALYVALVAAPDRRASGRRRPSGHGRSRIVLTAAAALALVPARGDGYWHEHPSRPAFFAAKGSTAAASAPGTACSYSRRRSGTARSLWQAESGFRFGLADGALNDAVPEDLPDRATMLQLIDDDVPPGGARAVLAAALAQGVNAILVDRPGASSGRRVLDPRLRGRRSRRE